jgi:hypothetical protein
MVKGINKQMVILKMDDNRLYDSACFVLRNDVKQRKEDQKDMLYEANRILAEMEIKKVRPKKRRFRRFLLSLFLFLLGAAIGFGVSFFM